MAYFSNRYYKHPFFGKVFFRTNAFFDIPFAHVVHATVITENKLHGWFTKAVTGTPVLDDIVVTVDGVRNPVTAINMEAGGDTGSLDLQDAVPEGATVLLTIKENDANNMGFVEDYVCANTLSAATKGVKNG